jgi:hypothetical protein
MMGDVSILRTLAARRRCHGTWWCCQYVDEPNCNSWNDPHRVARFRYRIQARREQRRDMCNG